MKVEKSEWGPGPWENEPDEIRFERYGYSCVMLRNKETGNWNGYVGLPGFHPWSGKHYDQIDCEAHGGLTFADDHCPHQKPDGKWWIGFDCAHAGDFTPGIEALMNKLGYPSLGGLHMGTYRDERYVRTWILKIVRQARQARLEALKGTYGY